MLPCRIRHVPAGQPCHGQRPRCSRGKHVARAAASEVDVAETEEAHESSVADTSNIDFEAAEALGAERRRLRDRGKGFIFENEPWKGYSELADDSDDEDEPTEEELYKEFDRLLALPEFQVASHSKGDTVTGTVLGTDKQGALVDVGGKGAASCLNEELSVIPVKDASEILRRGMVRTFRVVDIDRKDCLVLSLAERERELQELRLQAMHENDITVRGRVISANVGGVVVDIGLGLPGFVPSSHLGSHERREEADNAVFSGPVIRPADDAVNDEVADLLDDDFGSFETGAVRDDLIGEQLDLKFLEVDIDDGRLMMSARRVDASETLVNFKIGDVVEGIVSRVVEFGAFIDVVGGDGQGLLHISQISHDRIGDVHDLLAAGDRVKVMIMAHDRERGRLAFSTKKLEPTPGDMLSDPARVFAMAEDMAELFKIRVRAAEEAARKEEAALILEDADDDLAPGAGAGFY